MFDTILKIVFKYNHVNNYGKEIQMTVNNYTLEEQANQDNTLYNLVQPEIDVTEFIYTIPELDTWIEEYSFADLRDKVCDELCVVDRTLMKAIEKKLNELVIEADRSEVYE